MAPGTYFKITTIRNHTTFQWFFTNRSLENWIILLQMYFTKSITILYCIPEFNIVVSIVFPGFLESFNNSYIWARCSSKFYIKNTSQYYFENMMADISYSHNNNYRDIIAPTIKIHNHYFKRPVFDAVIWEQNACKFPVRHQFTIYLKNVYEMNHYL